MSSTRAMDTHASPEADDFDPIEHRREQNRLAQRRFRHRKRLQERTQRAVAIEQKQSVASSRKHDVAAEWPPGSLASPRADPHALRHKCLLNRDNGLLGIQSYTNFDDVMARQAGAKPESPARYRSAFSTPFYDGDPKGESLPWMSNLGMLPVFLNEKAPFGDGFVGTDPSPATTSPSGRGPSDASEPAGWLLPLHLAAQKGNVGILHVLLLKESVDCNQYDSNGLTPLMHAAIGGFDDVAAALLAHGAQIDAVDQQHGRSALHWAVLHRRTGVLQVLLNHSSSGSQSNCSAVLNGYDSQGRTPLHTAIDTGFEEGVLMLLEAGADVQQRACIKS